MDIPHFLPAPYARDAFGTPLADGLAFRLNAQLDPAWFCPEGACGQPCRDDLAYVGVQAVVRPVLTERPVGGPRADGHLRFWRIRFERGVGGWLSVDSHAECDAIGTLRVAAHQTLASHGLDPWAIDEAKVGREACGVSPQGAADWHLQRTGALAPQPLTPASWDRPHVALLDTGVDPAWHQTLDLTEIDLVGQVPEPSAPGTHGHGSAMAELLRQIAPPNAARLTSYRVMDGAGVGVVAHVARALDEALFADNDPLVANLSLGWLPELERRRRVQSQCTVEEGAVGSVLRYMLHVARAEDRPDRPVLIVSAAGNRPLHTEQPELFRVQPGDADICTEGWWLSGRAPMLMPAEWRDRKSVV